MYETNDNIYYALLQIHLTLISPRLPSPVTLLFNRPARGLLPKLNRPPISYDNDANSNMALVNKQPHAYVDVDTYADIPFLPTGSTVVVQGKDAEIWTHGTEVGHVSDDHNCRS